MAIVFNEKKATQAAARMLQLAGGTINYMALIKYLYLVDREALLRWGRLVTYDDFYEMKLGPVLSTVMNLITEMHLPEEKLFWPQFISEPSNYNVRLVADPGNDELSEAEEELIAEIFATYGHYKPFDLVDLLHKILPELKGISKGREPIPVSEILRMENKSPDEINSIIQELESVGHVHALFGAR